MQIPTKDTFPRLIVLLGLCFAAFNLFWGIGNNGIHIWDEAIYANNALEIAMHGDWWIMRVDGIADLYNTKPPLAIWLQSVCVKIFGPHEWAIRLPSALAAFATCVLLMVFSSKTLRDWRIGVITILILVSSQGFVRFHVTRTADLDALLCFFTTAYTLWIYYLIWKKDPLNFKHLGVLFILIFLAYFTKSTAALLPLPGILLGVLILKRGKIFIKNPLTYFFGFILISLIGIYYWFIESKFPGYFDKVWFSEFRRMTENIMPWHTQPTSHYISKLFFENYFQPFIYLFLFLPLLTRIKNFRNIAIYLFSFVVFYLILISIPFTKIAWYMAPLYPIMSLGVGIILMFILDKVFSHPRMARWSKYSIILAITIILFPLRLALKAQEYGPKINLEYPGYAIKSIKENYPGLKSFNLLFNKPDERHRDCARFYTRAYNHYFGYEINLCSSANSLKTNIPTLVCLQKDMDILISQIPINKKTKIENCYLFE